MKKILLTITLLLCTVNLNAQVNIDWQKCIGGTGNEFDFYGIETSDGGYIVSGVTESNDGDVSGNHGEYGDIYIVKLNASRDILWQKCLGGSSGERLSSIQQTADGGYILFGWTQSNDGDVFENHGGTDVWIVKINATGTIQWQKCLGGSAEDCLDYISSTSDGGYILSGFTDSNDGDVSGNHGSDDAWVVKINATGTIQWQKSLGGSNAERLSSMQQTADGGYILSGSTSSNDGDVAGNHGRDDAWVVKINATGTIQWQKCLGGTLENDLLDLILPTSDGGYILSVAIQSNYGDIDAWVVKINESGTIQWQKKNGGNGDERLSSIQQTADGGYILFGHTSSNDGDVFGNHGSTDAWVVKINATGTIQWQKCLGGSNDDWFHSILSTSDGGYILLCLTLSNNGDVSENHGDIDIWIVKLNTFGTILSQKCLGGSGNDVLGSMQQTADGGNILSGFTTSNDGDVSGNHGGEDAWFVKLNITGTSTNNLQSIDNVKNSFTIYPNPANNYITIDYDGQIEKVEILDLKGAIVYSSIEPKNELNLPQNIQSGYYTVVIQTAEGIVRKELVINR